MSENGVYSFRLRKNYEALVQDLEPRQVLNYLYQEDVIDSDVRDEVRAERTPKRQAETLLSFLERRGELAIKELVVGLENSSQKHLARLLKTPLDGEESYMVPLSGMSQLTFNDDDKPYSMHHSPCGFALIINNYLFDDESKLEFREGSTTDVTKLTKVFQQLNFTVISKSNLAADETKSLIRKYSLEDHTRLDCFVLFFMSHGTEGAIFTKDGQKLRLQEDIISKFNTANCPTLASKPKLFFVQACRGKEADIGITVTDGPRMVPSNRPTIPETRGGDAAMTTTQESHVSYPTPTHQQLLPRETDVFIGFASSPNHAALRNTVTGGWFVNTLCEVFEKYADKEDLLSMMTRINGIVNKRHTGNIPSDSTDGDQILMQAPEQHNRLRKKIFFNTSISQ